MGDRQKILSKIQKCLALSASSNEHEAATALRQARALMQAHDITDLDVQAAQAEERRAKANARTKPANWEAMLASKVGNAFGCKTIFSSGFKQGEWVFIGCGAAPDVAQYAFAVLARQARRARTDHIHKRLKRCRAAIKVRRADLFSQGWVNVVTDMIAEFAGNEQQQEAINAYTGVHYPSLYDLQSSDRNANHKLRDHDYADYFAGADSGQSAKLDRGVAGVNQPLSLE